MLKEIDYELRKVAAVTTLKHLCTLNQLEQWVKIARKKQQQIRTQTQKTQHHENKNHTGNPYHA